MEASQRATEEAEPPSSSPDHERPRLVARDPGVAVQPFLPNYPYLEEPIRVLDSVIRTPRSEFQIGEHTEEFRRRFYPEVTHRNWNDWRWQLRNRVRTREELERFIRLTDDERDAIDRHRGPLPVAVTPYYLSLLSPDDATQPLRRTVIPVTAEYVQSRGEALDPLDEDADSPVPHLVHRYPDRVLFLATDFCSVNCRYCTRSRLITVEDGHRFGMSEWERGIAYVASTPEVRDVLISGGDPLTLSDEKLEWLLSSLRAIPHVEFIRIGTKTPAVLPQRITPALTRMLRRYHPVWISLHFTHPDEITPETAAACQRLADAGIPLGSQTVLLKGINDNVPTLKALFHGLLKNRVKPYYLFQCDPIYGSSHFRTSVARGLEMIEGLRGHTTGYAVPSYVIDAPGGGGKIPLLPQYVVGRDGDDVVLRNYEGKEFRYYDPIEQGAGAQ
jgi:lysine 2,3-aminomutase